MPPTRLQSGTSEKPSKPSVHIWPQMQAVFWILLSILVGFYGNGKRDLVTVARHHPDVWRYFATVPTCAAAPHSIRALTYSSGCGV